LPDRVPDRFSDSGAGRCIGRTYFVRSRVVRIRVVREIRFLILEPRDEG
jgi:hypothetical protein